METEVCFPPIPPINEAEMQWSYTMRRDMQEMVPKVFLGPYGSAGRSKLENLCRRGITHIVCIRQAIEAAFIKPNFPDVFNYLVLDIADNVTENIIQHFPKVRDFIDECLRCGGKVLVHGNAGISRSAALVIAYIMERYGLPYREAFLYVQQKRFCISLNEGFAQQLKEYEPIYRAKLTLKNGEPSIQTGHLKRKLLDEDMNEGRQNVFNTS